MKPDVEPEKMIEHVRNRKLDRKKSTIHHSVKRRGDGVGSVAFEMANGYQPTMVFTVFTGI